MFLNGPCTDVQYIKPMAHLKATGTAQAREDAAMRYIADRDTKRMHGLHCLQHERYLTQRSARPQQRIAHVCSCQPALLHGASAWKPLLRTHTRAHMHKYGELMDYFDHISLQSLHPNHNSCIFQIQKL